MFRLDTAFLRTSHPVGALSLCAVRLQDDSRWPWIVLVPRVEGAREIEDLGEVDQAKLMREIVLAAAAVRAIGYVLGFAVEKLNVGLIGNITPQLHAHVVGRRDGDSAWPGPVWGVGEAAPYAESVLTRAIGAAESALRR
jgi:diadenosine tetraphosphate (Ap4A) HIT family hydrolase